MLKFVIAVLPFSNVDSQHWNCSCVFYFIQQNTTNSQIHSCNNYLNNCKLTPCRWEALFVFSHYSILPFRMFVSDHVCFGCEQFCAHLQMTASLPFDSRHMKSVTLIKLEESWNQNPVSASQHCTPRESEKQNLSLVGHKWTKCHSVHFSRNVFA